MPNDAGIHDRGWWPILWPSLNRDVAKDSGQLLRPDSTDVEQIFRRGEWSVGFTVLNDRLGSYRTDAGQGVQFFDAGGVEVHREGKDLQLIRSQWLKSYPPLLLSVRKDAQAAALFDLLQQALWRKGKSGAHPPRF